MKDSKFSQARATLTLWYGFFIFCLVLAFSVALYTTENQNFIRVVIQRNFGNRPPGLLSAEQVEELREQVVELRRSVVLDLIIIDSVILVVGTGLGYLLAGKTLDPIRENFEHQKEFLANASHEFRTPLAAIQTAAEVVLRSKSKTKEDYKKVVSQTLQESIRLGVMADELLMLTRIDAGIATLDVRSANLSRVVMDAISEIQPMVNQKKIKLSTTIVPDIMWKIDLNRIKQLVLILLDNAIKFTPSGGQVKISLQRKSKPILVVSDTGSGISKIDLPHIFDRFYQASKSRGGNSSGLGLSIAKWIVVGHEGRIEVESTPQKGSTFTIEF